MVYRSALDDPNDPVAVSDCSCKRLQQNEPCAFAPYSAVGAFIKSSQRAGGRKDAGLAVPDEALGRKQQAYAPGERHFTFVILESATCQVKGVQRTGTRRVNRGAGAAQVKVMGDAVRNDRRQGAGRIVR